MKNNLKSQIESILLVSEKPVKLGEIAEVTEKTFEEVEEATLKLIEEYKKRGIRILQKEDEIHLATAKENAEVVAKFLNTELRSDLTKAALEVLAIITYKQPVTRIEIENIRGVSSDYLVRTLLLRGLIQEVGRKEAIGKPILYGTTIELLNHFGLEDESELPEFEDVFAVEQIEVDTITKGA